MTQNNAKLLIPIIKTLRAEYVVTNGFARRFLFYEKDAQVFEDFSKLAIGKDDNMSRYVKRMIIEELKKQEK